MSRVGIGAVSQVLRDMGKDTCVSPGVVLVPQCRGTLKWAALYLT